MRGARRSQSGQAAVETAIVVPLMTFFILGILQLTLMHQASLMLEYAAFNAARSGAVWNMDKGRMKQARVSAELVLHEGLPRLLAKPDLDPVLKQLVDAGPAPAAIA